MVGFLTYGNKKFADLDPQMRKLIPPMYSAMKELLPYVDHDAAAFNEYMVRIETHWYIHWNIYCILPNECPRT